MVREYEHRRVIRRRVAPPPFPAFIGPRTADRAEHVPAENPRAEIFESARCEVVVDTGRAAVLAKHVLKGLGREYPVVHPHSADAHRIFEALIRPGAEAVERYRKTIDAQ